jgi:hypothetical protein
MRLFIAIELADDQPLPMPADHSAEQTGPLLTFVAQLAVAYLRAPASLATERRARDKAIASYRTALRDGKARLDRFV